VDIILRVAVLFEFPSLNGGEHSMLSALAQLIDRDGFEFIALAPDTGPLRDELDRLGMPVMRFHVRDESGTKRTSEELIAQLRTLVTQSGPHVLHANSLSMSRLMGQAVDALPDSVGLTGHIRDIMKISRQAIIDLNRLNRVVAVSKATKSCYVDRGLINDHCAVIYNGVDLERFSKRPKATARARSLPEVPPDAHAILNVGQICLRKGQLDLSRSVIDLLREHDDVHLVLAGARYSQKTESRDYEQSIEDTFLSAGRHHHLHRLGYRADVADLMNASDVLVHSAHQEPLGRVLLEAAASELPIIATDVGGTREILRAEQDAMLVPPGDIAAMKTAIKAALDDPAAGELRATSVRHIIEHRFAVSTAADALGAFWRACPDENL